jgi:hypothetical protein
MYPCIGINDYWGYPEKISEFSKFTRNENRVIIEGEMAEQICRISGGECPPNYPANIQEDGSAMIGITRWDANTRTEKSFVFIIKNNTLSYDVRENKN